MSELLQADDDSAAIAALVSDLHWQIDQLAPRGIKDNAGNPYNPSYYKRGLKNAEHRGGVAVADYIRHYLYKPPSNGYKKLERPTRWTSRARRSWPTREVVPAPVHRRGPSGGERAARAAHQGDRGAQGGDPGPDRRADRAAHRRSTELRAQAEQATDPEVAIAVNTAILRQASTDVVALIRLGRAYDELGAIDRARESFQQALAIDPKNRIAERRLNDIERRGR